MGQSRKRHFWCTVGEMRYRVEVSRANTDVGKFCYIAIRSDDWKIQFSIVRFDGKFWDAHFTCIGGSYSIGIDSRSVFRLRNYHHGTSMTFGNVKTKIEQN